LTVTRSVREARAEQANRLSAEELERDAAGVRVPNDTDRDLEGIGGGERRPVHEGAR
jgi:hypothetical protein